MAHGGPALRRFVGRGGPTLHGRLGGRPLRAFSLAEMMIALAILGMGLLVIAAALPVGIRYTRDSINMATGEAAAEYALDLIEQSVSLPQHIFRNNNVANGQEREAGLFQPRLPLNGPDPGVVDLSYEPLIKVRSLYTQNVSRNPATYGQQLNPSQGWVGEQRIRDWLPGTANGSLRENDFVQPVSGFSGNHLLSPALPSLAIVYPPITTLTPPTSTYWSNLPYFPSCFWSSPPASMYQPWSVTSETTRVADRRTVWNAFYRRVSYPDLANPNNVSDPYLYELITVVSRLPSARHRFPVQNPTGGYGGADTAAPIPWLVTFNPMVALPAPTGSPPFDGYGFPQFAGGAPPATLAFTIPLSPNGTDPLPVGSIFIPARNDFQPSVAVSVVPPGNRVGFGPPAPTTLPIYEVVERPDATTVVTKYNGYYPMQGDTTTLPNLSGFSTPTAPRDWPVWVIPPAYEELDNGSPRTPLFPNRSTIVAVGRRYVHLREIP